MEKHVDDTRLPFKELAKRLPRTNRGKVISISTLHRWRQHGLRGVKLEAIRLGGIWVASVSAVENFSQRLTLLCSGNGTADGQACSARLGAPSDSELDSLLGKPHPKARKPDHQHK